MKSIEVSDFTRRFNPDLNEQAVGDVLGSVITDIHQLRSDINELRSAVNILFRSYGKEQRV